ncbi:MAG: inorganic phosphate transporter [Bacteroidetes bacterium]|nr:inorganic phosphate transporter [Bacteroidota bacterium]MBP7256213.1 inorganic phosphate transporter [Chitinophagales bacterium]MBK7139406.1 inorganic phosphate transporter [Bacteroidota bacterium]MBK8671461.1 inorganic phosphate transporter [Bacteroidota bacterium]MBK9633111.1 inorganic phosphate transporter [Bacteroidota bacterium]
MTPTLLLIFLIVISLIFDFLNGFHDSANVVATMISSRAMSGNAALALAAVSNLIGPFLFGVAVANTIGHEVAAPESITIYVVLAALLSASIWNLITWYFGIPASSSHGLIGGIIGAVIVGSGFKIIKMVGLWKIIIALFLSPIIGFIVGWLVLIITKRLLRNATPNADIGLKYAQIPTAIALALSHGTNDAQKTMGVITMGLVVLGFQKEFVVPYWVILISALAIGAGTAFGGWRIIKTLGGKFYKIRPIHSFSSQLASAFVILTASFLGGPVSTTQVVSMSIMGAGAGDKISKVRWSVLKDIFYAWFLTIPLTAILSAIIYLIILLISKI